MIFGRYLLGNFLRAFVLFLLGWVVVFVVIDFVGNIRMWLQRGMEDAGEYYLNYLPHIVWLIMPLAILLAVISALGNMARHLEISAIQGAGYSPLRLLTPLLLCGLLIVQGMYWVGEEILPDANHRRLELAQPHAERRKNPRIKDRSNFVFIGAERFSLHLRHYAALSKQGRDPLVLIFEDNRLVERFDAKVLRWTGESWELRDGIHRRFRPDAKVVARPFRIQSLLGKVDILPDDLINERQTADEMNRSQIAERIEALARTGEDTRAFRTQWHFKLSGPWVNFLMLVIGAALAHRYTRSGSLSTSFGIGLFVAFSYYVSIKVGLQMGETGVLEPWLGAWLGNLVFGFIAFIMLIRSFRL